MKPLKKYTTIMIVSLLCNFVFAQQGLTTIDLPSTDGGSMQSDIIVANGNVIVHVGSKLKVYDSNLTYQYDIELCSKDYGKFNPLVFNARLHGKTNLMAYNTGRNELYVVTPELGIRRYKTNTNPISLIDETLPPSTISHFKPLHGLNILKFDPYHYRLYWVVKGRIGDHDTPEGGNFNCTGRFHYRERYFAIFDVNQSNGAISLFHSEQSRSKVLGEVGPDEYNRYVNSAISDVSFNRLNDKYYLIKLNKVETWEITQNNTVQKIDSVIMDPSLYCGSYYKFGQLKYIYNANIHKIIALPYRYPSSTKTCSPKMVIIDGGTGSTQIIETASRKILDAEYLSNEEELLLCYAPANDEIVDPNHDGTDIAVYEFNVGSNLFSNTPSQVFSTNQLGGNKSTADMNSCFDLIKLNESSVLALKKDQVNKVDKDNNGNYKFSRWYEAEGNHFYKGVNSGPKTYVLNMLGSGIECFTAAGDHTSKKTGYPVNKIEANVTGDKMYFFHQLNMEKTGIYVHHITPTTTTTTNLNEDNPKTNDITGMIGDVVYNPYKKQFLVSQVDFSSGTSYIKVINDDATNSFAESIALTFDGGAATYPKEMVIAPDKRLYVMANMQHRPDEPGYKPKVLVYRAAAEDGYAAYTLIYEEELNVVIPTGYHDYYEYYSAHFAYNASENKVYASIHPTENTFDPYTSIANSMYNYINVDPPGISVGRVVKFGETGIENVNSALAYPGKIICPNTLTSSTTSQFATKVFVIGEDLYEYDFQGGNSVEHTGDSYNNIVYCPEQDVLFALKDVKDGDCESDRYVRIDQITYNGTTLNKSEVTGARLDGQPAAFFYNPHDMKVYIHLKFDDAKLGGTNAGLYSFDPAANPITIQLVEDLGKTGIYPELDHCNDFHFYYYPFYQPYINPYTNKIYLPNGGLSCVSVVDFEPNESLTLKPGELEGNGYKSFTWLSFPRLDNAQGDPSVNDVLGDNNISPNEVPLEYLDDSEIENRPFNTDITQDNVYTGTEWPATGYALKKIYSTHGYKLSLLYTSDPGTPHVYLEGTTLAPDENIPLYGGSKENWTGYWLYPTQDIFDALGNKANYFYLIKHQDWTCMMTDPWTFPGGTPPPSNLVWECDKKVQNISYGEMVILKSNYTGGSNNSFPFQWMLNGQLPSQEDPTLNPSYYTAQEQIDYTPMLIELDSADKPLEIGAFINDTCVGGTGVESNDSVVAMRVYLDGNPADSVEFELYNGGRTSGDRIKQYYVWNRPSNRYVRKAIAGNAKEDYYIVSLKKQKQEAVEYSNTFNCWPNPASTTVYCQFELERSEPVVIQLLDISGRVAATWLQEAMTAGHHQMLFALNANNGNELKPGVYFINYKAGETMETKKMIVK